MKIKDIPFACRRQFVIYVGCKLTGASKSFVGNVDKLKCELRKLGFTVLDFIGTTEGSTGDIWDCDINQCVRKCDLMIAICDYASTGLGIEMGVQIGERKMPVLICSHECSGISRLITDIPVSEVGHHLMRYRSMVKDVPVMALALYNDWHRMVQPTFDFWVESKAA
jgi:hypothetical protein